MNDQINDQMPPSMERQPKRNTTTIIIVVIVVLLCCCCAGLIALYFGYDSLGDPFGIYGSLPQSGPLLLA